MSQTRRVQRKKIVRTRWQIERSRRKHRATLIRLKIKDYGMLEKTRVD